MKAVPFRILLCASICLWALAAAPSARAASPVPLTIVIFSPPSLGAVLPGVIKQQKLDQANGLDITFAERTPDAYAAQFNSGEFQLGGSAALLTLGLADTRGVKVAYLFNLFDYWGAVVTQDPAIKSVADLRGKQMAAAKGTTNYAMFEWLAKQQGLDPSTVKVLNTATAGLVGYALANRADAVQLWEPAYTLLKAKKPDIRLLDLGMDKTWASFAGGGKIPYLGVAAHDDWIAANQALIPKLYATYKAAGEYIVKHPDEAALLINPKGTPPDRAALVSLIKSNDRLGMNVAGANDIAKQINAVYKAGIDVGYLKKQPSNDTIYDKPLK